MGKRSIFCEGARRNDLHYLFIYDLMWRRRVYAYDSVWSCLIHKYHNMTNIYIYVRTYYVYILYIYIHVYILLITYYVHVLYFCWYIRKAQHKESNKHAPFTSIHFEQNGLFLMEPWAHPTSDEALTPLTPLRFKRTNSTVRGLGSTRHPTIALVDLLWGYWLIASGYD